MWKPRVPLAQTVVVDRRPITDKMGRDPPLRIDSPGRHGHTRARIQLGVGLDFDRRLDRNVGDQEMVIELFANDDRFCRLADRWSRESTDEGLPGLMPDS